jgi:CxxC motif-containing protein (DUF1111 family)
MKRTYGLWYLVILAATIAPVALRVMTWSKPRQHQEVMSMVKSGEILFKHEWKVKDPLANGGDGLGPVFNATSCVKCHEQGGVGGSGGVDFNVTTFTVRSSVPGEKPREGVVHSHAINTEFKETMAHVSAGLPNISQIPLSQIVNLANAGHMSSCIPTPRGVHFSQRNTPALFGAKLVDEIPDREIIANERLQRIKFGMSQAKGEDVPVGRAVRFADGRVGRFGWKAQSASLSDFVQAACANELGLGNPGQKQPKSLAKPDYVPTGLDLTQEQCDSITAYVASLPRPIERAKDETERGRATLGKKLFLGIGCADCHTPKMGDVDGLYSDLLLHRMGQPLEGGGSYNDPPVPMPDAKPGEGPGPGEWRTPPLWGVADSAPYLHDGRAATLEEAITLHGGQGKSASQKFNGLPPAEREQLIAFLKTLRAPTAGE